MNSELYKLFMKYPEMDEEFINLAYEIIMKDEEELQPHVKDFIVSDEQPEDKSMGAFSTEERSITVYPKNIVTHEYLHNKKLQALVTIRHELEHVRNIQRLYECRSDIESMIIRYANKDYAVENGLDHWDPYDKPDYFSLTYRGLRDSNYVINPEERMVNIKAWKYVVNLLKNQRKTQDLKDARTNLYFGYARGYESNGWYLNPPAYEFLLKLGMYHEFYLLKKTVEATQYCFNTRLLYGLPLIDDEEYDKKILQKVRLEKRKKNQ